MAAVAVLFPGQGAQSPGMGKRLAEAFPEAARVFAQADEALGFPLSDLCFNGPEQELNDTANAQPAIFVASLAAWQVLRSRLEFSPIAVAGHSLGEYSALVAAGALDFADGVRLVRARGLAMRNAGTSAPGAMLAVLGLDLATVTRLCAEVAAQTGAVIEVANDNCPGQVVVAGERPALEAFAPLCLQHGSLPPTWLKVSVAPHTALMRPALPELLAVLETTPITAPSIPILGNSTADWLPTSDAIRQELREQVTRTVRWADTMRRLIAIETSLVLEVGPGKVLTGLMRTMSRTIQRVNFGDNPDDVANVVALLHETNAIAT